MPERHSAHTETRPSLTSAAGTRRSIRAGLRDISPTASASWGAGLLVSLRRSDPSPGAIPRWSSCPSSGRTFHGNGDKGTDHGHGSIYWVPGGSVRGGWFAGQQVRIAAETLNQQRDLPVMTDYRGLTGEIAQRQFGWMLPGSVQSFPTLNPPCLA